MRVLSVAIALTVCATGALAQSAGTTTTMTCEEARQIVASQGSVVLNTGPDTFDRYVSNDRYCASGQYVKPAFVPTRNTQECEVGFRCRTE